MMAVLSVGRLSSVLLEADGPRPFGAGSVCTACLYSMWCQIPLCHRFPHSDVCTPSLRSFAEASPGGSFSRVLIVYSSDLL